jgi:hypothetical protein
LFRVTAEVVWSVPPLADAKQVASAAASDLEHSRGKILVTRRGAVPIAVKAHNLQVNES